MKTADAMKEVNKELSDFGVDNAKDILKRMEAKVEATENIAQAYSDLDSMNKTSSQKIDEILAKPSSTINDDRLSKFYESIKK
jgi:phage shock protein A